MARQKVVVAKRGCTCCGTGCVVIGAVMPLSVFAVWESFGIVAASLLWPAVIAVGNGVRLLKS